MDWVITLSVVIVAMAAILAWRLGRRQGLALGNELDALRDSLTEQTSVLRQLTERAQMASDAEASIHDELVELLGVTQTIGREIQKGAQIHRGDDAEGSTTAEFSDDPHIFIRRVVAGLKARRTVRHMLPLPTVESSKTWSRTLLEPESVTVYLEPKEGRGAWSIHFPLAASTRDVVPLEHRWITGRWRYSTLFDPAERMLSILGFADSTEWDPIIRDESYWPALSDLDWATHDRRINREALVPKVS